MIMTLGALALIAVASSTREGRLAAKAQMAPYERAANIATVCALVLLFMG